MRTGQACSPPLGTNAEQGLEGLQAGFPDLPASLSTFLVRILVPPDVNVYGNPCWFGWTRVR